MEPNEEDLRVAKEIVEEHKCGTLYIGKERTQLRESIATALAEQRSAVTTYKLCNNCWLVMPWRSNGGTFHHKDYPYTCGEHNEIIVHAAIRAGDKE